VALSFFTRNLAPLAPPLVALLEDAGQKVDPKLRECADARARHLAEREAAPAPAPAPPPAPAAPAPEEGDDLFLAAMRAAGVA